MYLFSSNYNPRKVEILKVLVLHWYVGILHENIFWQPCVDLGIKLKREFGWPVDVILSDEKGHLKVFLNLRDSCPNFLWNFDLEVSFMSPVIAKAVLYCKRSCFLFILSLIGWWYNYRFNPKRDLKIIWKYFMRYFLEEHYPTF